MKTICLAVSYRILGSFSGLNKVVTSWTHIGLLVAVGHPANTLAADLLLMLSSLIFSTIYQSFLILLDVIHASMTNHFSKEIFQ